MVLLVGLTQKHGPVGEGLIICPAVEEVGSYFGPGDSDPLWNLDDFPQFSGGAHLFNRRSFNHQVWDFCWPDPPFHRSFLGCLPGRFRSGSPGLGGLVPCFFFFLWTILKLSSSCEESGVLGLLAGVKVIPFKSLWVGPGSSGSLVVGTSVSACRWPWNAAVGRPLCFVLGSLPFLGWPG